MSLRYLKDIVTLQLNEERCSGCGMCTQVCVHGVFAVSKGIAHLVDRDACMECGACARNCPVEAVSVRSGVGCAYAVWKSWFRRKKEGGEVGSACS
jgi:ferredoxin